MKNILALILAAFALNMTPVQAEPTKPAYRMRASIYQDNRIIGFATWTGYEDRATEVVQAAKTPYASGVPLTPGGKATEGLLETTFDMTVRPFRYAGALYLDVDLQLHDVASMNRYRSDELVEELPTKFSFGAGGDYEGRRTGDGWLFVLTRDGDQVRAEIEVEPVTPVEHKE